MCARPTSPFVERGECLPPERDNSIKEEVQKLVTTEFVQEVYYSNWLANVVMVKRLTESGGFAWTSQI